MIVSLIGSQTPEQWDKAYHTLIRGINYNLVIVRTIPQAHNMFIKTVLIAEVFTLSSKNVVNKKNSSSCILVYKYPGYLTESPTRIHIQLGDDSRVSA